MIVYGYTNYHATAPTCLVIGNFDGVHVGHQRLIQEAIHASQQFNGKTVALTFDPHPLQFLDPQNSPALLTTLKRRAELLIQYGIDAVIIQPFDRAFADLSAEDFIQALFTQLYVQHVCIGPNIRFGRHREGHIAHLESLGRIHGYTTQIVPITHLDREPISSSRIREALRAGNHSLVSRLIDRDCL